MHLLDCFLWRRLKVWMVAVTVVAMLPMSVLAADVAGSGNYKAGEGLFTGQTRFTNGGPSCISCHDAGVGSLGGGNLGPNLTKVWDTKSFFVDVNWVNGGGSPVMGPIFSKKNVTEEEMEHLKAFFSVQAQQASASSGSGKFIGIGFIGFIIILIFFSLVWSGRYRNRVSGTAHDALWRNYGGKGGK
ncbi:MAG: hypothetical protein GQ522_01970 [Deltaproteobacteria bacterium]|jgi:mono/diheme cytochrome c family protein|nr:hypothetical protein [Deltaproteobacteria bacterium]